MSGWWPPRWAAIPLQYPTTRTEETFLPFRNELVSVLQLISTRAQASVQQLCENDREENAELTDVLQERQQQL